MPDNALLPAEQVDRDAAADAYEMLEGTTNDVVGMRAGQLDGHWMVQMFIKHRHQSQGEGWRGIESAPSAPGREEIVRIISKAFYEDHAGIVRAADAILALFAGRAGEQGEG